MEKNNLVVAHCHEDIDWINRVDRSLYNIILVSKTRVDADIFQQQNIGNEASAYLEYIVKYYDDLPRFSVFVHGHEYSYHQNGSMPDLVNGLCFEKTFFNFDQPLDDPEFYLTMMENGKEKEGDRVSLANYYFWRYIPLILKSVGGFPVVNHDTFQFRKCAQFLVHRDLIRRHSRDQWSQVLADLITLSTDPQFPRFEHGNHSKDCACAIECAWFAIFTGLVDEKAWNDGGATDAS